MINRFVILLLVLLMLPMFASAEIYKYRDQNGVLRFTDNLTEVPISQRDNIQQYQEIKAPAETLEPTLSNAPGQETAPDPKALEKELTDEKGVLDDEYGQLTQIRKGIESVPKPSTPEAVITLESKIKDYNDRLNLYNANLKAFREKLEAYQKTAKE